MDVRRVAAVAAALALLAGCTAHARTRAQVAATGSSPAHVARPSPGQAPRERGSTEVRTPLTLLPPGCASGQLRLRPASPDGGGGEVYQVWSVHLVSGPPCTLWGTPEVRFLDARGAGLPFSVTRHWLGRERRAPVLVDARHSPAFPVAKYRCDTTRNPPVAAVVVATLPLGAGALTGTVPADAAHLTFCPGDGGDQRVHVGAIGSWQTPATGAAPRRVAINMSSRFEPLGLPTWGRADLDGDGHRDTVVVHPSGLVVATVGGRTTRIRVPGRPTDRLQGFTDLTGDGHPEVLVATTALGCDAGYRFCASSAIVLTLRGRRLRTVHFPDSAPSWDDGQGDLFAGLVCGRRGLVQVQVLMTGGHGYRLIRVAYRVTGLRARAVARGTSRGTGTPQRLAALAKTRCPGLGPDGWAPEHGPLG